MKYTGIAYPCATSPDRVRVAVVTAQHIAIDWDEDDMEFSLVAVSCNGGRTYKGIWGDPVHNSQWAIQLTRHNIKDKAILLFAEWHRNDIGDDGVEFFILQPEKVNRKQKLR